MSNIVDNMIKNWEKGKEYRLSTITTKEDILIPEIIKLRKILKEIREYIDIDEDLRRSCEIYDVNGIEILKILDKEVNNGNNNN